MRLKVSGGSLSARLHVSETPGLNLGNGGYIGKPLDEYEGPYSAVPSWDGQTFATAGLAMREDFQVNPITKQETPNEARGLTLSI